MSNILKDIGIVLISLGGALLFGFLFAHQFALLYEIVTKDSLGGTFLDFTNIVGALFGVFFFSTFFLGCLRSWLAKIVAALFMLGMLILFIQADLSRIYFPIVLGLLGYGIGWGARKFFFR